MYIKIIPLRNAVLTPFTLDYIEFYQHFLWKGWEDNQGDPVDLVKENSQGKHCESSLRITIEHGLIKSL